MQASSRSWTDPVARFAALSTSEKIYLLKCVPVVAAVRVGLTLLSYRTLKRWVPRGSAQLDAARHDLRRVSWGVRNAARVVPGASCLTQALAAQFLLARAGHASNIHIGVAKDDAGHVIAHAWLVCDGRVVVGGSIREVRRYSFLADLDAEAR